jgi:hypothetical protein
MGLIQPVAKMATKMAAKAKHRIELITAAELGNSVTGLYWTVIQPYKFISNQTVFWPFDPRMPGTVNGRPVAMEMVASEAHVWSHISKVYIQNNYTILLNCFLGLEIFDF